MLTRVKWFAGGVAAGALGAAWAYNRVRELRGPAVADQLAGTVAVATRRAGDRVRDAMVEGREAMRDTRERMAADLDERYSPAAPTPIRREGPR